jgi:hypothetical protein
MLRSLHEQLEKTQAQTREQRALLKRQAAELKAQAAETQSVTALRQKQAVQAIQLSEQVCLRCLNDAPCPQCTSHSASILLQYCLSVQRLRLQMQQAALQQQLIAARHKLVSQEQVSDMRPCLDRTTLISLQQISQQQQISLGQ